MARTRIVMVTGDKFAVEMGVDTVASEIMGGADARVRIEPVDKLPAYLRREHIAYVQEISTEPMVGGVEFR